MAEDPTDWVSDEALYPRKSTWVTNPALSADAPTYRVDADGFFTPFDLQDPRPVEPPAGTVMGFTKRYPEDGPSYSFAAVRAFERGSRPSWYVTGPRHAGVPVDWDGLLDFIGGPDDWSKAGVATQWSRLT